METTVKQRLISFIEHLAISKNAFEKNCGLSLRAVSNIKSTISDDTLKKIVLRYPELNPTWVMLGEGPMLRDSTPRVMQNNVNRNNNYISGDNNRVQNSLGDSEVPYAEAEEVERAPILPATLARAPQMDILEAVNERLGKIELAPIGVVDVPISLWYRVQDESVAPKYEIGDLIALWAYPKGEEDPMPGKLYGINTLTNGLIIRKLLPHSEGYIARSVNREEFPDYLIKRSNVVQIYKIMLMVRF